jgi:hypothetical protein
VRRAIAGPGETGSATRRSATSRCSTGIQVGPGNRTACDHRCDLGQVLVDEHANEELVASCEERANALECACRELFKACTIVRCQALDGAFADVE